MFMDGNSPCSRQTMRREVRAALIFVSKGICRLNMRLITFGTFNKQGNIKCDILIFYFAHTYICIHSYIHALKDPKILAANALAALSFTFLVIFAFYCRFFAL